MGTTNNYSWPYPELSDEPNVPADIQALATAIDPDVKSLDDRITVNEADISDLKKGWNFIAGGTTTDSTLTIDVTAGGKYPEGTFRILRIWLEGQTDTGNDALLMRINGDSTSIYNRAYSRTRLADGSVQGSQAGTFGAYVVGWWSAFGGNNTIITLNNTDVSSDVPLQSTGNRAGASGFDNNREVIHCHGTLEATRLVSSLFFFSQGTPVMTDTDWNIEGFRL